MYELDHELKQIYQLNLLFCRKVELKFYTQDKLYLDLLRQNLTEALAEFSPDLIVYNAGTDILSGDPLGGLEVSPKVNSFPFIYQTCFHLFKQFSVIRKHLNWIT